MWSQGGLRRACPQDATQRGNTMTSRTDIEGSPVLTGPWPDPVVPGISLPEVLLATAAEHAERPALIDASSGRTLHYGELADGMHRVASGLAGLGLRPGDVFAILAPNSPEWLLACYGALAAGGVVTGINPLCTPGEVAAQLTDACARFVLTGQGTHQGQRIPGGPGRTRGPPAQPPRGGRRRRHPGVRRARRRTAQGLRRPRAAGHTARTDRLRSRAGRTLQAHPPGGLHRCHSHLAIRQDATSAPDRRRTAANLRHGALALTSTRLPGGGATVEVARRQPDGSWRWVIDQRALLS